MLSFRNYISLCNIFVKINYSLNAYVYIMKDNNILKLSET